MQKYLWKQVPSKWQAIQVAEEPPGLMFVGSLDGLRGASSWDL